jgi:hypothetical protein
LVSLYNFNLKKLFYQKHIFHIVNSILKDTLNHSHKIPIIPKTPPIGNLIAKSTISVRLLNFNPEDLLPTNWRLF